MRPDPHPPRPPVLVVDVGSSATKLALATGAGEVTRLASFPTGGPGSTPVPGADLARDEPHVPQEGAVRPSTAGVDGWEERFGQAMAQVGPGAIGRVGVSSVVPAVIGRLQGWAARLGGGVPVHVVGPGTVPLAIDYRPPSALGPDRLAGAVAAVAGWGAPVVVVDVGTAITCDLVAPGGRFAGGAIAPGPVTAYRGLVERVPHLALAGGLVPELEVETGAALPSAATSTRDAVRVGVLRGAAALVDGLVRSHRARAGPCPVIVTGGLGPVVARHCETVTTVDPDLTLRGIALVAGGPTGWPARRRSPRPRRAAARRSPAGS